MFVSLADAPKDHALFQSPDPPQYTLHITITTSKCVVIDEWCHELHMCSRDIHLHYGSAGIVSLFAPALAPW